ncbi:hypothetical protein ACQU0X_10655 [Pseudovibrio ascidiaceicola]|uniref:hypothetical protein n=1 Tax=Pseudovibrio ascidiaceicola TaxID=285279 RepID=UPI003D362D30
MRRYRSAFVISTHDGICRIAGSGPNFHIGLLSPLSFPPAVNVGFVHPVDAAHAANQKEQYLEVVTGQIQSDCLQWSQANVLNGPNLSLMIWKTG